MLVIFNIRNCLKKACFIKSAGLRVLNTVILFTFFTLPAISQNYNFEIRSIPLEGELANFSGQCFLQDRDGFMWFGSTEGLYRYDGSSFKKYRHNPDHENSLSNNNVSDLYEDSAGMIWIATQDGLNRYDKYSETFTCFRHKANDSASIAYNHITRISEDKDRRLWIATNFGFSLYDGKTETFRNYQIGAKEFTSDNDLLAVYDMHSDMDGHLWVWTTGHVYYRFDIASEQSQKITKLGADTLFSEIMTDGTGRLVFFTSKGLLWYDRQQHSFKRLIFKVKDSELYPITAMTVDANGNTWTRYCTVIHCFNPEKELIFTQARNDLFRKIDGEWHFLKELFTDNQGNIWFYSRDAINHIIQNESKFRIYNFDDPGYNQVNCIYPENKDFIWLGSVNGVIRLRYDTDKYLQEKDEDLKIFVQNAEALSMLPVRNNKVWVGMRRRGLLSMTKSVSGNWQFNEHHPASVDSIGLDRSGLAGIKYMFEDKIGRLWIRSLEYRFPHYYDTLQNKVVRLVDNPLAVNKLPENGAIRHLTGSDTLWYFGSNGIYNIVLPLSKLSDDEAMATNVIECKFLDENNQETNIPAAYTSYLDSSGNIWLGTDKYGLFKVFKKELPGEDDNTYHIKSYSISEGLPALRVMSIVPDKKGNLWMGTNNGLSKFNIRTETFTNYFVRHGLPGNEFTPGSAAMGEDGELFFGTMKGMVSFYPDSISTKHYAAPVMFTGLNINNQSVQPGTSKVLTKSISYTDKIELNYNQSNISIEFALLNYSYSEFNKFRYRLKGFNDEWIYTGNRNMVEFTNLDPGKYTFLVSGLDNNGIWNERGKSLEIIIHRPPWLTWYAYLVYILLLAGIALWYRRYLRNKARLRLAIEVEKVENEKLHEMDQIKSRFFANISHEFRTPLTLIRGPLDDLSKQKTNTVSLNKELLGIMRRSTLRLQNLINQLLDISKIETGKLTLQVGEGDLDTFIRTIILSFLSLADSKKISYKYQLSETKHPLWFDKDKLEKILVNLLSNALKFTPYSGEINIKSAYIHKEGTDSPEFLELSVTDTGIGIPADKLNRIFDRFYQVNNSDKRIAEGTGIGLALTKELVEIYRGEIKVESKEGKGTSFFVRLPVGKDQFRSEEFTEQTEEITEVLDASEPASEAPDSIMEQDADNAENKPVVLIVEDNPDLITYIAGNLKNTCEIMKAENGKEGFDLAKENIPDLVISDLMMPVMDGMEMCRLIKSDERTNHIPVIMLTAKADRSSKLQGLKTGADDYIIKPFDAEELQVRVKNLIGQRNLLREKFKKEFIASDSMELSNVTNDPFIKKILRIIEENYSDFDFSIEQICNQLLISNTQFYRKVHALTGELPNELLRSFRIKKAAALLRSEDNNITGVMYQVGYKNTSHFAKTFKKYFGQNPSEYRDSVS